jgi:hypothetical protein
MDVLRIGDTHNSQFFSPSVVFCWWQCELFYIKFDLEKRSNVECIKLGGLKTGKIELNLLNEILSKSSNEKLKLKSF